jgi:hypothetical protein
LVIASDRAPQVQVNPTPAARPSVAPALLAIAPPAPAPVSEPAASGEPEPPRGSPLAPAADSGDTLWARIVGQVRSAQPALGAVLDHGMPLEVNATTLRLGFPDGSFFGRQAQSAAARESLLKAAELLLGQRPNLLIGSPGNTKISTLAEIEETGRKTRTAARREAALSHPRVVDALEIFEESPANVDVQVDLE